MKAYIEVSVINRSVDQGRDPVALLENLKAISYAPVLGLHVVYELAKSLLTTQGIARGRALFALVDDLAPIFHWSPQQLMEREVERVRRGTAVLPFLDHLNHVSAVMEVRRLRAGIVSAEARQLIETREADIAATVPENYGQYLRQVDELRAQFPGRVPRLRTYEQVLNQFAPDLHRFVAAVVNQHRQLASADDA